MISARGEDMAIGDTGVVSGSAPIALKISSFGDIAISLSRGVIVVLGESLGTAHSIVPSALPSLRPLSVHLLLLAFPRDPDANEVVDAAKAMFILVSAKACAVGDGVSAPFRLKMDKLRLLRLLFAPGNWATEELSGLMLKVIFAAVCVRTSSEVSCTRGMLEGIDKAGKLKQSFEKIERHEGQCTGNKALINRKDARGRNKSVRSGPRVGYTDICLDVWHCGPKPPRLSAKCGQDRKGWAAYFLHMWVQYVLSSNKPGQRHGRFSVCITCLSVVGTGGQVGALNGDGKRVEFGETSAESRRHNSQNSAYRISAPIES